MTLFVREQLQAAANSEKAPQMQAYLKTEQAFYGVQAPIRKRLFSEAKKQFVIKDFAEYQQIILELWHGSHREEMYQALEVAGRYKKFCNDEAIYLFEALLQSSSNWDLVDWIAIGIVGDLIRKNRDLEAFLIKWRNDPNFWMRRSALIGQLKHKQETNIQLLGETIEMLMHEKEFFIRKAIGWSLREYAKTDPAWVIKFVAKNKDSLSGLSQREALKHLK